MSKWPKCDAKKERSSTQQKGTQNTGQCFGRLPLHVTDIGYPCCALNALHVSLSNEENLQVNAQHDNHLEIKRQNRSNSVLKGDINKTPFLTLVIV